MKMNLCLALVALPLAACTHSQTHSFQTQAFGMVQSFTPTGPLAPCTLMDALEGDTACNKGGDGAGDRGHERQAPSVAVHSSNLAGQVASQFSGHVSGDGSRENSFSGIRRYWPTD